jgi:UDP-N-acetylglucosamine diphosphorylase / glucose-1-phosphate thymidylyltransferase / UDP-N-acetylgalactosamine diphosphorylase / glucosamine-1-phosphate N-acetyltransferase / galactosamine-1-phosphate N-acetyltransferase
LKVAIFEDNTEKNLFPLNSLRGAFDIKCGIYSQKERIEKYYYKKPVSLFCRNHISEYIKEVYPQNPVNVIEKGEYLFINSNALITDVLFYFLSEIVDDNIKFIYQDKLIALKLSSQNTASLKKYFDGISEFNLDSTFKPAFDVQTRDISELFNNEIFFCSFAWDYIKYMDFFTEYDLDLISKSYRKYLSRKQKNYIKNKKIFVSPKSRISSQAVLDASHGKIFIDESAEVEPFAFIKGPAYIGKNALIKSGAKILGPCVIGFNSRVAGEISHSIFHSLVNKQHDGFIGHTYACEFVNFGADTITSNLKNNYSKVSVIHNGEKLNTGMQFLGSLVGDHSKFGINTMLNTGTIVGVFSNIAGGGFPSKEIKPFSWYILGKTPEIYKIDDALRTAEIVMSRRNIKISENYKSVAKHIYNILSFS